MQISTSDGKTFQLTAITAEDHELMHALDMHGTHVRCTGMSKAPAKSGQGFISNSAILEIDPASAESIRADAGRQALRAFSQLIGLGLRQAAQHGHISAAPAHPQAQEQLATSLIELQVVAQALGEMVSQQKAVLQEMRGSHANPLCVETPIVKE